MSSLPYPEVTKSSYRPDIDGLRAVAVLAVVAFHAFEFKGGFIGVDIFFVISGYLISTIIFENLNKGTFSFTDFYSRRIRRIFPALILVLIACFALGWFVLLAQEYKQLGKHIAAGAGFVSNFVLWGEAGYFDNDASTKPLLHLWSLGIEEQFYIVWPLLLWFAWKRKFNLLTITILVAIISFLLNVNGVKQNAVATFYSPQTRFWELLSGSILAWLMLYKQDTYKHIVQKIDELVSCAVYGDKREADGTALSNVISFTGLLLLAIGFWEINKGVSFPGKWALIPITGSVLIIMAGAKAWVNRVILSNRVAVWFGLISFPLYLWHWPILSFARVLEGEVPALSIRSGLILLAIFFAWVTYKFIERPLRFGKYGKVKVVVLVLLMLIVGFVGYNTYVRDGLKFRNEYLNELAELVSNGQPKVPGFDCGRKIPELSDIKFDGECALSKDMEPNILFLGDSHTAHYKKAIWDIFQDDAVLMVVQTSCLPFSTDVFMTGECKRKYLSIISYLERNKSIKTIVLSGYWSYLISGGYKKIPDVNVRHPVPLTKQNVESFRLNSSEFLSRVSATGKSIILFKDIPDLDFNIKKCFDYRPLSFSPVTKLENCWMKEDDFLKAVEVYDVVLDRVLKDFPEVAVFDPRKYLCENGTCFATDGFLPYYGDGDHVNHHGAKKIISGFHREFFNLNSAKH